ncbi:unnamed protein product [Schistosoma margrebowiei]|uniref:Uncharacterized protein n=1 Tax=Schistosoma margrebowiei TaxID=48269 RepID=A0A183M6Q9_9TREM|nr:unnamed protein product [Schistosoma margrebowiei]
MDVIHCYTRTSGSNDDDKDYFNEGLQSIVEKCPGNDLTIMMGDLNPNVGTDNTEYENITGRHGLTRRKECEWRKIFKFMYIQQIGYRLDHIPTKTHTQSYMGLIGPHRVKPDRPYLHQ